MYLVVIAWLYVTVMMAVVEASSPNGTLIGAFFTLLLYGLLPAALVAYVMMAPSRRRALRRQEQRDGMPAAVSPVDPDAGRHAAGPAESGAVAPVRKET